MKSTKMTPTQISNKMVTPFIVGVLLTVATLCSIAQNASAETTTKSGSTQSQEWTCSMHPQIRQPKPGQCPICGMDLIPVAGSNSADSPREIRLNATTRGLAQIAVTPVRRMIIRDAVALNGYIEYEESRTQTLSVRVAGRIEKLFPRAVGERLQKGAAVVEIWSPDLITAQAEFLQAAATVERIKDESTNASKMFTSALESARAKLIALGMSESEIAAVASEKTAHERVKLIAPDDGVVTELMISPGMYVEAGMALVKLADQSRVWATFDVYENDLGRVHRGDSVVFSTTSYPKVEQRGVVSLVESIVDPMSRAARARVSFDNSQARLPADVRVRGVSRGAASSAERLAIPRTAPLVTGRRAIVFTQDPIDSNLFHQREIQLGAASAEHYVVDSGLNEGELVVTRGAFKLDASMQISGKESLMNPGAQEVSAAHTGHTKPAVAPLSEVFKSYFALHLALSSDQHEQARAVAVALVKRTDEVSMSALSPATHDAWMKNLETLTRDAGALAVSPDILAARRAFKSVSTALIAVAKAGDAPDPVYVTFCPMAFDNTGADWLQTDKTVANPYFGSAMYRCGRVTETIAPSTGRE